VTEHISRRELKQDKVKDAITHGAEAVWSHSQTTLAVLVVVLVGVASYSGWSIYHDRQNVHASAAFDSAMKVYSARIGTAPDPSDPTEQVFPDEAARSNAAQQKFASVAAQYSGNYYGQLARYYSALCLEDLDRQNQALEELKRISESGDKETASLAQFQSAVIYERTGKPDEAVKILRALSDKPTVLVPRATSLLELAGALRQTKPQEAATIYQQIKKEFPGTGISEAAERGLDSIGPKS
jgi:predicted negative regulator of RcsB-dependent stress response